MVSGFDALTCSTITRASTWLWREIGGVVAVATDAPDATQVLEEGTALDLNDIGAVYRFAAALAT